MRYLHENASTDDESRFSYFSSLKLKNNDLNEAIWDIKENIKRQTERGMIGMNKSQKNKKKVKKEESRRKPWKAYYAPSPSHAFCLRSLSPPPPPSLPPLLVQDSAPCIPPFPFSAASSSSSLCAHPHPPPTSPGTEQNSPQLSFVITCRLKLSGFLLQPLRFMMDWKTKTHPHTCRHYFAHWRVIYLSASL